MKTTYTVKTKRIAIKSYQEKIKIWFFGDVHRFTRSCDEERWKWFLQKTRETQDENTYYMGLGDYCNFASKREQEFLKNGEIHEDTIDDFDSLVMKRNRALAMEMKHMKGRFLGLIDGNHNWTFENGKTATEDLAERLDAEYLGWLSHFTLIVNPQNRTHSTAIHIVACHMGKAGGKTEGNTINQVAEMKAIFPCSDIYVGAHDHQRAAKPSSCLMPSQDKNTGDYVIKQKRQFFCRSGSFKKAYTPGQSSYEVSRLLKPADLGALQMVIGFHRSEKEGGDRVVTDIQAIL